MIEDPDEPVPRSRPWWFRVGILGVVLGGTIGLLLTEPRGALPSEPSPTPATQPGPTAAPLVAGSPTPQASPTLTPPRWDRTLTLADLPPGFSLTEERDDVGDSYGSGRDSGMIRFYARPVLVGIAHIMSESTLFASVEDAKGSIAEGLKDATETQRWAKQIPLDETIGDESYALEKSSPGDKTIYAIYFRAANTSNWIAVAGALGTVDLTVGIELAKKQLARL